MATLVNKMNREVKVIIPNMREFSTFYSDNEGVIPMFFKSNWMPVKEEHWKPSEEQINALYDILHPADTVNRTALEELYEHLKNLM